MVLVIVVRPWSLHFNYQYALKRHTSSIAIEQHTQPLRLAEHGLVRQNPCSRATAVVLRTAGRQLALLISSRLYYKKVLKSDHAVTRIARKYPSAVTSIVRIRHVCICTHVQAKREGSQGACLCGSIATITTSSYDSPQNTQHE